MRPRPSAAQWLFRYLECQLLVEQKAVVTVGEGSPGDASLQGVNSIGRPAFLQTQRPARYVRQQIFADGNVRFAHAHGLVFYNCVRERLQHAGFHVVRVDVYLADEEELGDPGDHQAQDDDRGDQLHQRRAGGSLFAVEGDFHVLILTKGIVARVEVVFPKVVLEQTRLVGAVFSHLSLQIHVVGADEHAAKGRSGSAVVQGRGHFPRGRDVQVWSGGVGGQLK